MRGGRVAIAVLLAATPKPAASFAESSTPSPPGPASETQAGLPPIKLRRADEEYVIAAMPDNRADLQTRLKYIHLGAENWLSIGGEFRLRGEFHDNQLWNASSDTDFWSHRAALHASLALGERFRLFGELYHGVTSTGNQITNDDHADLHQAFAEFSHQNENGSEILLRAGRQELAFGKAALVGIREWPNIRRSFDAVSLTIRNDTLQAQAFIGREVQLGFDAFDNSSTGSSDLPEGPEIRGIHITLARQGSQALSNAYLISFEAPMARFADARGPETRHSVGLRRRASLGPHLSYDFEATYQFGAIGSSDIEAFSVDALATYRVEQLPYQPDLGVQLLYTTGDSEPDDGELGTYNPMFINPAPFGQSRLLTPANIVSVKPQLSISPRQDLRINVEYAFYWRQSSSDGIYGIPRFLSRPSNSSQSRYIGEQIGLDAVYDIDRNWTLSINIAHFYAGPFLEESGNSENVTYLVPGLRFRF